MKESIGPSLLLLAVRNNWVIWFNSKDAARKVPLSPMHFAFNVRRKVNALQHLLWCLESICWSDSCLLESSLTQQDWIFPPAFGKGNRQHLSKFSRGKYDEWQMAARWQMLHAYVVNSLFSSSWLSQIKQCTVFLLLEPERFEVTSKLELWNKKNLSCQPEFLSQQNKQSHHNEKYVNWMDWILLPRCREVWDTKHDCKWIEIFLCLPTSIKGNGMWVD